MAKRTMPVDEHDVTPMKGLNWNVLMEMRTTPMKQASNADTYLLPLRQHNGKRAEASEAESDVVSPSARRADAIDGAYKARGSGVKFWFQDGDEVEFWSAAEQTWLRGRTTCGEYPQTLPAFVRVKVGASQKPFFPADFQSTLRHHVRCEAPWNPKAFSPCFIRTLRKLFYMQAGLGSRPCWSVRTKLCADELRNLWVAAEVGERQCALQPEEVQRIYTKVQSLLTDIGTVGFDLTPVVDVHELMHHALMLLHPPGPATSKALAAELSNPEPSARLPRIVSRWVQMDEEGCGLISPKDLECTLYAESSLQRRNAIAQARAMISEVDPEGPRQAASYSEFMAYCLGLDHSEVCLYWYEASDWFMYMSPMLCSQEGGLWRTSITAFKREYFLHGGRISWSPIGSMFCGRPARAQKLGITTKSLEELRDHVFLKLDPKFNEQTYDAVGNNGNHFVDQISRFLLGQGIPAEPLKQPQRLLSAPTAWMLKPVIDQWMEDDSTAPFPLETTHQSWFYEKEGSASSGTRSKDGSTSLGTPSGSEQDLKTASKDASTSSGSPSALDRRPAAPASDVSSPSDSSSPPGSPVVPGPVIPMIAMRIQPNAPLNNVRSDTIHNLKVTPLVPHQASVLLSNR